METTGDFKKLILFAIVLFVSEVAFAIPRNDGSTINEEVKLESKVISDPRPIINVCNAQQQGPNRAKIPPDVDYFKRELACVLSCVYEKLDLIKHKKINVEKFREAQNSSAYMLTISDSQKRVINSVIKCAETTNLKDYDDNCILGEDIMNCLSETQGAIHSFTHVYAY